MSGCFTLSRDPGLTARVSFLAGTCCAPLPVKKPYLPIAEKVSLKYNKIGLLVKWSYHDIVTLLLGGAA